MSSCTRERALVEAVTSGTNEPLSPADRAHLRECAACRETVAIATALAHDTDTSVELPSADVVWFRAQLRARAEAAQLAARPVLVAQALAGASVVGGVATLASALGGFEVIALATRGLLLAFALWLLIAPVAVYLATTED